jgi:hypothetical protein
MHLDFLGVVLVGGDPVMSRREIQRRARNKK